jgi:hypothetical protein
LQPPAGAGKVVTVFVPGAAVKFAEPGALIITIPDPPAEPTLLAADPPPPPPVLTVPAVAAGPRFLPPFPPPPEPPVPPVPVELDPPPPPPA